MRKIRKTDWTLANPGRGTLRVVLDGILLLLGLGGTMFTAVSVWALDVDSRLLLLICTLLSVLFLLVFSLPRFRWLAALLTFAVCALVFWRLRETLLAGTLQIAEPVLDTLGDTFDVAPFSAAPMAEESRQRLMTLTLAAVAVPLGGSLAWAIVEARSALLTLLLTLPWYLPAILADVVPDLRPLTALTGCYCLVLLTSTGARHDPRGSARFTLLCIPAVALLLAGSVYFLPQEEYKAPKWSEKVRARAEKTVSALVKEAGIQPLLPGNGVDSSIRLDECGPRRFTGETMMTVTSDTPGRAYLRGMSAAVYTGTSWELLPDSEYADIGLDKDHPLIEELSPLNLPSRAAAGKDFSEITFAYGDLSGIMYTPYQLANTPDEVDGVNFRYDAYLERRFGVREKNLYYRPGVEPSEAEPLTGGANRAEEAYAQFVREHYLNVPADFAETLRRWLERISATQSMLDAYYDMMQKIVGEYERRDELEVADYIAGLLEVSTRYDLDTPFTPEGEDFVDWFLNGSLEGYCVHYASAGTLILRAAGIPARYVEGYTVQIQAKDRPVAVKDSAAHAWVEVYLDGYGWYPVDMTPAAATGIERHTTLGGSAVSEKKDEKDEEEEKREDENSAAVGNSEEDEDAPAPAPVQKKEEQAGPDRNFLLPLLVILAVPFQSVLRRAYRKRRMRAGKRNASVIACYVELTRLEAWGGEIPEEAFALAEKARFSQHKLTGAEHAAMLGHVEEQRTRVWTRLGVYKRVLFWLSGA